MNSLEEIGDLESLDSGQSLSSENTYSDNETIIPRGLKTGLKQSLIPAVILDTKLNILWENYHYRKLFIDKNRKLPVNLVTDFSPYIDPVKLKEIIAAISDENTGFSYKGRLESRNRNRLTVLVNIIITPLLEK